METRRDVFQAIADPTRRQIIGLLAGETQNLNSLAEKFDVSRQAISFHIKILTECGLVVIKQKGRDHYCEAKLKKLNEVFSWVEQYHKYWDDRMNVLENYLDKLQKERKNAKRKK
jgi:DNA-binding transcriptional ArsR family regulator